MKAIRRSFKSDKERESRHQPSNSLQHKSATAIVPPKKVIKALYDYEPQNKNGQELGFRKGDFFHVLSREDDSDWYEACNPMIPSARGLVPVAFFEIINKQQRQSGHSVGTSDGGHDSGFSEKGLTTHTRSPSGVIQHTPGHSRGPSMQRANAMVYGIVQYDFHAERPDELDAKTGEPIIVVAQSNPEWFVAKPIGRLGGPGLIPVSYVDIKDTSSGQSVTDPLNAVRSAGVPSVEEWKRTAAEYKNSSISLGQINTAQANGNSIAAGMGRMSMQSQRPPQMPPLHQQQHQHQHQHQHQQQEMPLAPISASVPRYCFDNDMYWYIIEAEMEDGRWWELSRYYADFYDFQIALLEAFPDEAGNRGHPRTLPFMPGPVAHVTDAISNGRRQNLDEYIKKIVSLPRHISQSMLVRNLFKPKPGQDYEIDPNALNDDYRLSNQSLHQNPHRPPTSNGPTGYGEMPRPGSSRGGHRNQPSYGPGPNGHPMPPPLHTQASTLTQNSTGTSSSVPGFMDQRNVVKLKVTAKMGPYDDNEETKVFRVPPDIDFTSLKERIGKGLALKRDIDMMYKDETTKKLQDLRNESNFYSAVTSFNDAVANFREIANPNTNEKAPQALRVFAKNSDLQWPAHWFE